MKLVFKVTLSVILIVIFVFATLFYSQVSSRDCLDIPEPEAIEMIDNIFRSKNYNDASDGVIFGNLLSEVEYSRELNREPESDKNLGFVELQYNSKLSGQPKLSAVIYSNCEIQWVKKGT